MTGAVAYTSYRIGYIGQYANLDDLKSFLTRYRTDMDPGVTTFALHTIDGGSNPQAPSQAGTEANLDVQYTIGVATGVPTSFLSVGDNFQDDELQGFLDTVNFALSESVIPNVMTTSYGEDERDISRALAKYVLSHDYASSRISFLALTVTYAMPTCSSVLAEPPFSFHPVTVVSLARNRRVAARLSPHSRPGVPSQCRLVLTLNML